MLANRILLSEISMDLIRPRFTEFHKVFIPLAELDFAIPFLDEDIPLYVDPFLLWRSPGLQDKGLHQVILGAFNNLGVLSKSGNQDQAVQQLIAASECDEVGLGDIRHKEGHAYWPRESARGSRVQTHS